MDSSRSVGASHEDDRWSVPEPESAGDPDATAMHIRRHQSGQMTPPLPPQQRDFFLRDWCLICMQQVPEKSRSEHCATAVMHRQRLAARSDFMRQCVNGARRFYEAHAAGDVGSAELYQPTHPALSPIDNHKKKKKKKTTTTKKRVQGLTPKASPSIDQSLETAALLAVTPEPMSEQSSDWSADVSLAAADTTARRHRSKPQSFVRNGTPTDRNSVPRLSLSGSESRRRSIEKATALPKKKSKKVERSVNGTKGVGRTMWSPPAESPSHPVGGQPATSGAHKNPDKKTKSDSDVAHREPEPGIGECVDDLNPARHVEENIAPEMMLAKELATAYLHTTLDRAIRFALSDLQAGVAPKSV